MCARMCVCMCVCVHCVCVCAHTCMHVCACMGVCACTCTVDQEIFMLKIICVKNFRVDKFLSFRSIYDIFLTVNGYNTDKHLESS